MTAPLRIGETAQRLGVTPDTVRDWVRKGYLAASRTPTGQLVFDEDAVEALRLGERQPSAPPSSPRPIPESRAEERSRTPAWKELAPWQAEVESTKASLTLDELEAEREQRTAARERERRRHERGQQQAQRDETERQRIERHKKQVFQSIWIESVFRAQVAAGIEAFATPERVPAWLTDSEQYGLIAAHAGLVLEGLRAEARQRGAEEQRATKERKAADAERLANQMRALFTPPTLPSPPPTSRPRSVAEALRRRHR
ncbi:MAG: MerR family transcriptional regulator [Chloroflexota bacterium]